MDIVFHSVILFVDHDYDVIRDLVRLFLQIDDRLAWARRSVLVFKQPHARIRFPARYREYCGARSVEISSGETQLSRLGRGAADFGRAGPGADTATFSASRVELVFV